MTKDQSLRQSPWAAPLPSCTQHRTFGVDGLLPKQREHLKRACCLPLRSPIALVLIAVIAALLMLTLTQPAAAQSPTDYDPDAATTEVRIAAKRLDDGRVEFALQERGADGSWGERILPRRRFFPATGEGRWLSSSSIEVSAPLPATELQAATTPTPTEVRIAARRLDDGRVEFALQERGADGSWGERILPRRRFFPATGEGRWLSSSSIEVSVPLPAPEPPAPTATPPPAPTQTAGSFTDSTGRTIRYQVHYRHDWNRSQPRGAVIDFHGNNEGTEDDMFWGPDESVLEQGLLFVRVASPESFPDGFAKDNRSELFLFGARIRSGGARNWNYTTDYRLIHELLQSNLDGNVALDHDKIIFRGGSQGTSFLARFLERYATVYGGGFHAWCGDSWLLSPRPHRIQDVWSPTVPWSEYMARAVAQRMRVFVEATTGDHVHDGAVAMRGLLPGRAGARYPMGP